MHHDRGGLKGEFGGGCITFSLPSSRVTKPERIMLTSNEAEREDTGYLSVSYRALKTVALLTDFLMFVS